MNYKKKYHKYKYKYLKRQKILQEGGDYKKYNLEPTTLEFINNLEAKNNIPIYQLPIKEARGILRNLTHSSIDIPVDIEEKTISNNLTLRIIRPNSNKNKLPMVFYIYGGGWILGSKLTHDRFLRQLVVNSNVAYVLVNYTPAPEAHFPIQINQAYEALLYLSKNADKLNLDSSKLIVSGDSVGGNMTIALTLLAKEKNEPHIDYQILYCPVTDANMNTDSYQKFANGPWLTKATMEWFFNAYEPNENKRNNILISPIKASIEQLRGLPTALVITGENDVLRDEGEAYAHKLMDAGVKTTAFRYLGTTHDFAILDALKNTPDVENAILVTACFLKKIFNS